MNKTILIITLILSFNSNAWSQTAVNFSVNQPAELVTSLIDVINSNPDSKQNLGSMLTVSGGISPYTFLWQKNDDTLSTTQDLIIITSGISENYLVSVADSRNCYEREDLYVNIINENHSYLTDTACNSYTSPTGNVWTTSGTYTDTVLNKEGADSIITIFLTINEPCYSIDNITACNGYTWLDGITYTENNNTATYTLNNIHGCDSIITLDLTIMKVASSSINITECDSYNSPSGKFKWTQSGRYTDTIPSSSNCDSVITIELEIINVDTSITILDNTLISNEDNGSFYQWFNCKDPVSISENKRSYKPVKSDEYAVYIEKNGCIAVSSCSNPFLVTSLSELELSNLIIYPIPTERKITVDFGLNLSWIEIRISSLSGQEVFIDNYSNTNKVSVDLSLNEGVYIIQVMDESGYTQTEKIIVM